MRRARWIGLAIALVAVLLLSTLAIPIRVWRTGELPVVPLPLGKGGPSTDRIWVDTDAACGAGPRVDPDDCFALLLLSRLAGTRIVGISTVFGNAPLQVVDDTVRDFVAEANQNGRAPPPVYRGAANPLSESPSSVEKRAHDALRDALQQGPLTILALGPLTNIAASVHGRPDLAANIARLVIVMGRRQGHLFHPSEGRGKGILFGHGPVFRDFNYAQDRRAAELVIAMGIPLTMVPYEAARNVMLTDADLRALATAGAAAAWVASRARGWLRYWNEDIGRDGFYPFDLVASAYVLQPEMFGCASVRSWISPAPPLLAWFGVPDALFVGLASEQPERVRTAAAAIYCPGVHENMHPWLMRELSGQ